MSDFDWSFDDRFVRELPGDSAGAGEAHVSRVVLGAAWSPAAPEPASSPALVGWSPEVAALVGLDAGPHEPGLADVLTGNRLLPGMRPWAGCYGGHQFGHWAGQLGDGRAITLGEAIGPTGERLEVQLKGAGRTPYSRRADGRAVLRSSVREFLCSEAMHHLGIPTTRALSLCTTGDPVLRDMFYDGRAALEPGAVVARVAPSFLRFGSYQIFAARQDLSTLGAMVDFTLRHHFPHLDPDGGDATRLAWLHEVAERTCDLVVGWQRVGFVHGVLNTDNMSILGLTIDYGPYGWLDHFDPDFTPNTSDADRRRYRYAHQPGIGAWNLARLLEAIAPLMNEPEALQEVLDGYTSRFGPAFLAMMGRKLGLTEVLDDDDALIDDLLELLVAAETDMTLFFRGLAEVPIHADAAPDTRIQPLLASLYREASPEHRIQLVAWLDRYATRARADRDADARSARMNAFNPRFILRNHLVQVAIDRAMEGDFGEIEALLEAARRPYDAGAQHDPRHVAPRPDWARDRPGCSRLSCSS